MLTHIKAKSLPGVVFTAASLRKSPSFPAGLRSCLPVAWDIAFSGSQNGTAPMVLSLLTQTGVIPSFFSKHCTFLDLTIFCFLLLSVAFAFSSTVYKNFICSCHYLVLSFFICHSNKCGVVSYCSFNFLFHNNKRYRTLLNIIFDIHLSSF